MKADSSPQWAYDVARAFGQSLPFIYVETADQPAAEKAIVQAIERFDTDQDNTGDEATAVYHVDSAFGLRALNKPAIARLPTITGAMAPEMYADPLEGCKALMPQYDSNGVQIAGIPPRSVVLHWAADVAWRRDSVPVALLCLRDVLTREGTESTIVGLGSTTDLPPLIASDVHIARDPMPTQAEQTATLREFFRTNELTVDDRTLTRFAVASLGLTGSQALMGAQWSSVGGIPSLEAMEDKTRALLADLPGVSVATPEDPSFYAGMPALMEFARRTLEQIDFRVVVVLDEVEKLITTGDAGSNESTEAIKKALLDHYEARTAGNGRSYGIMATGLPGLGKTTFARVLAAIARCPMVVLDTARLNSKWVGEGAANAERTFRALRAMGGYQLIVSTCNRTHSDRPTEQFPLGAPLFNEEFTDRAARLGTFFFEMYRDMRPVFAAQARKFGLPESCMINPATGALWCGDRNEQGWTPRDVASILELVVAGRGAPIAQYAERHRPALANAGPSLDLRRRQAEMAGYWDAATGERYRMAAITTAQSGPTGARKLRAAPVPVEAPAAPEPAPAPATEPTDDDVLF